MEVIAFLHMWYLNLLLSSLWNSNYSMSKIWGILFGPSFLLPFILIGRCFACFLISIRNFYMLSIQIGRCFAQLCSRYESKMIHSTKYCPFDSEGQVYVVKCRHSWHSECVKYKPYLVLNSCRQVILHCFVTPAFQILQSLSGLSAQVTQPKAWMEVSTHT